MSIAVAFVLIAIISYLIGTVNFSKIIAWNARRKDITKVGSGNPGTMNMLRSFGFKLALFTLIAEVIKAGLTALIVKIVMDHTLGYGEVAYWFSGLFLMLGNDFPVWSKFKGGKGVASTFGFILVTSPVVALADFITWIVVAFTSKYSSLSALTAAVLTPVYAFFWADKIHVVFYGAIALLVIVRHHANIKRLLKGEESKIKLKKN